MSKYTPEQLKEMALDLKYAYHTNDPRFQHFLMDVASVAQCHPQYVMNMIETFVQYEE